MSTKYWRTPALRLDHRGSGSVAQATALLMVACIALAVAAGVGMIAVLLLALFLVAGAVTSLQRLHRRCGGLKVRGLQYDQSGWSLLLTDGGNLALLAPHRVMISSWLLAASFQVRDSPSVSYRLFLLSDGADAETWRRLALGLRYGRHQAGCNTVSTASAAGSG